MKKVRALISFIVGGSDVIAEAGQELMIDRGLALDLEKIGIIEPIQEISNSPELYN